MIDDFHLFELLDSLHMVSAQIYKKKVNRRRYQYILSVPIIIIIIIIRHV